MGKSLQEFLKLSENEEESHAKKLLMQQLKGQFCFKFSGIKHPKQNKFDVNFSDKCPDIPQECRKK